jgi:hypothetical protein
VAKKASSKWGLSPKLKKKREQLETKQRLRAVKRVKQRFGVGSSEALKAVRAREFLRMIEGFIRTKRVAEPEFYELAVKLLRESVFSINEPLSKARRFFREGTLLQPENQRKIIAAIAAFAVKNNSITHLKKVQEKPELAARTITQFLGEIIERFGKPKNFRVQMLNILNSKGNQRLLSERILKLAKARLAKLKNA